MKVELCVSKHLTLLLARNSDLNGVISSLKQMEDRFNKKFQYPYIFLNEKPFDDGFKKFVGKPFSLKDFNLRDFLPRRVTELTDADVKFGLIPKEHWEQPPEIDEERATASRNKMVQENVIYGGEYWSSVYSCSFVRTVSECVLIIMIEQAAFREYFNVSTQKSCFSQAA